MRRRIFPFVAACLSLSLAAPVAASSPSWEAVVVDETFYLSHTSAACGFDVFEHDEGELRFQILEMADGTLRFKDLAVNVSQSITAPSRGTSVQLQPGGRGGHVFVLDPDGSARELSPGTNGHVTVPGAGVIYLWAGVARAIIAPDGTVTETAHGVIMDDYSSLCGLLAG